MHAVCGRESPTATRARVVKQSIDRFTAKMRALDLPFFPRLVGAQNESSLHRADKEERLWARGGLGPGSFGGCLTARFFRYCSVASSFHLSAPRAGHAAKMLTRQGGRKYATQRRTAEAYRFGTSPSLVSSSPISCPIRNPHRWPSCMDSPTTCGMAASIRFPAGVS